MACCGGVCRRGAGRMRCQGEGGAGCTRCRSPLVSRLRFSLAALFLPCSRVLPSPLLYTTRRPPHPCLWSPHATSCKHTSQLSSLTLSFQLLSLVPPPFLRPGLACIRCRDCRCLLPRCITHGHTRNPSPSQIIRGSHSTNPVTTSSSRPLQPTRVAFTCSVSLSLVPGLWSQKSTQKSEGKAHPPNPRYSTHAHTQ